MICCHSLKQRQELARDSSMTFFLIQGQFILVIHIILYQMQEHAEQVYKEGPRNIRIEFLEINTEVIQPFRLAIRGYIDMILKQFTFCNFV